MHAYTRTGVYRNLYGRKDSVSVTSFLICRTGAHSEDRAPCYNCVSVRKGGGRLSPFTLSSLAIARTVQHGPESRGMPYSDFADRLGTRVESQGTDTKREASRAPRKRKSPLFSFRPSLPTTHIQERNIHEIYPKNANVIVM